MFTVTEKSTEGSSVNSDSVYVTFGGEGLPVHIHICDVVLALGPEALTIPRACPHVTAARMTSAHAVTSSTAG